MVIASQFYMPKKIVEYRTEVGMEVSTDDQIVDEYDNLFNAVPLIEYRNNEERQGDFEQLISLIDAYNLLQTGLNSVKKLLLMQFLLHLVSA